MQSKLWAQLAWNAIYANCFPISIFELVQLSQLLQLKDASLMLNPEYLLFEPGFGIIADEMRRIIASRYMR
jgi:hypothetical protein